jgi:hypothetical protein
MRHRRQQDRQRAGFDQQADGESQRKSLAIRPAVQPKIRIHRFTHNDSHKKRQEPACAGSRLA